MVIKTQLIIRTLEDCEVIIQRGLNTFIDVGNALLEIRDNRLYKDCHATFEDYCKERWDFTRQHAYRLMEAAEVAGNLSPIGDNLPTAESQARPLTQLEPEQQREVWGRVTESGDKVTASRVQEEVDSIIGKAHVSHNSGNNEWYTPSVFIEAARAVMGSIDTDPASSDKANEIVLAGRYFTKSDDGRFQRWGGNVWMNPPYSQPLILDFCELLVQKYRDKEIQQACVLVNNATETVHYQHMMEACSAICFIKGRVKFVDESGDASGAPLQGQSILYFGLNQSAFAECFSAYGVILYAK